VQRLAWSSKPLSFSHLSLTAYQAEDLECLSSLLWPGFATVPKMMAGRYLAGWWLGDQKLEPQRTARFTKEDWTA